MSCNHCSTKFSFFHKELGCANCGLSFCHKCLRQKCRIPSKGSGEYEVCRICFTQLSSASGARHSATNIPPPDILQKRLESLDSPISTLIMSGTEESRLPSIPPSIIQTDSQLLERLKKLKNPSKVPPPSEWELRKRLAVLQGANEYVEAPSKPLSFAKDTRTDTQQAESLLDQFMKERDIALAQNPQDQMEARIANLREMGVRPNEGAYITNLHDSSESSDEDEVDKITRKIMDEVALDEKTQPCSLRPVTPPAKSSGTTERPASPELPWCVLCNDDAKWRCHDCDDLYCDRCNREAHKEWGDTDHKVVPYKRKD